jgi:hypothetical protein
MSLPFTMTVPLDARYRVLAPQVAGKYAELQGGSPADGEALARALADALEAMAAAAGADAHADLVFRREADGVEIEVQSGSRSSRLRHRLPAPKA